ncbi:MAG: PD-(D/E)XK nuclease family protein [Anaerolineales bacterium]|nr:PD-(D/E)XK nuclease family protein [Anaerolineales bacterium]
MENKANLKLPMNFTFSQSSLQDYADCPRRFQLRYMEQLSWPAVETEPVIENEKHQQEGNQFHRLAQQYLIGLPEDKISKMALTPNLQDWWENFLNSKFIGAIKNGSVLYPEMSLAAPIGSSHRLVAKYDLIAVSPDHRYIIVDWKTYQKRPKDNWMALRWQTLVYRALLVRAGSHLTHGSPVEPSQIEMVYWYTNYPSEPAAFPYNKARFERDWDLIETTVKEISELQSFEMTTEAKKCRFCVFRSYCDRGTQAGDWLQAEAEMEPDPEHFDINFEQIGEIAF